MTDLQTTKRKSSEAFFIMPLIIKQNIILAVTSATRKYMDNFVEEAMEPAK